jgi:peroxiredoxin Q/BCP
MPSLPNVGDAAPDFEATSDAGEPVRLADYRGKKVVLYFYPKADTPGCTKQACLFRDNYGAFEKIGVVVLGASHDTIEEQAAFKQKYNLPFTLLADPDHELADLYGIWGTHKITYNGVEHTIEGVRRSTVIIDETGNVIWSKFGVDAANNTQEVLDALA